jgi:hypothetical protein
MMRKLLIAAIGIAAFVVPSSALGTVGSTTCQAAGTSGSTWDGTPTWDVSGTVATNFTVPAGSRHCRVFGADIKGNTSVGGSLEAFGGTFEKNVGVVGGSFGAVNHGVTIDGNLSFLDPAANSANGFWPPDDTINLLKGNLSYTIDSNASYPCYGWPALYLGSVTVDGNFNYTGYTFNDHLYTSGLTLLGSQSVTSVAPQSC